MKNQRQSTAHLVLLAVVVALTAASTALGSEPWVIEATIEMVEATAIDAPATQVLSTETRRIDADGELAFRYLDPTNGHQQAILLTLAPARPRRSGDQVVRLEGHWRDLTNDQLRQRFEDLAVDGKFSVVLYRHPERDTVVFLRCSLAVRRDA